MRAARKLAPLYTYAIVALPLLDLTFLTNVADHAVVSQQEITFHKAGLH